MVFKEPSNPNHPKISEDGLKLGWSYEGSSCVRTVSRSNVTTLIESSTVEWCLSWWDFKEQSLLEGLSYPCWKVVLCLCKAPTAKLLLLEASSRDHTNIPWVVLVCLLEILHFSLGVGVQVGDRLASLFELITQVS